MMDRLKAAGVVLKEQVHDDVRFGQDNEPQYVAVRTNRDAGNLIEALWRGRRAKLNAVVTEVHTHKGGERGRTIRVSPGGDYRGSGLRPRKQITLLW